MTDVDKNSFHAYYDLGPDRILDAVTRLGYCCDGRFLALNSYENRVYQIGLEDAEPVIVKFYRPGRWSNAAIFEEHAFTRTLAEHDIPVVQPLPDDQGRTLHLDGDFRFAVYPRRGGRAPELDDPEQLKELGRLVARLHNAGSTSTFRHRPSLSIEYLGVTPRDYLLSNRWLPPHLEAAYASVSEHVLARVRQAFARAGDYRQLRLHGDCHPGNLLRREAVMHVVDFDDCCMGPAMQDLWMFLSGDREYMSARLADLLTGYTRFREFDPRELHLIEALRALRMMHYAGWIARRWEDPAFPQAFPDFGTDRYWENHVLTLKEQMAALDAPVLAWRPE